VTVVQLSNDTEGRRYCRRKLTEGKTTLEAMRALKRRLSDVVYRLMTADANDSRRAREDTWGRLCNPARPTRTPGPALRKSHFPDPPNTSLEHRSPPLSHRGAPREHATMNSIAHHWPAAYGLRHDA
jgi:hypothetical protein